ncbi:cysteine-rich secretory family protein [Krasilnikovia cinnamomea]|uniref:Cysteine-rich secretory family protein n=1 Tax=Krasilnikovia cinnamomea TaxID=349313 RepID=A0A4Q7ZQZ3_9ACTN|nr:CAP domain-containing protein [Krasilnikovia cinnamomea]RZU53214.1 cysteine-rich secretory family protein [Krasilnikovia cinnamomea]
MAVVSFTAWHQSSQGAATVGSQGCDNGRRAIGWCLGDGHDDVHGACPGRPVSTARLQSQLVTYPNNTRVRAGCKPIRVDSRLLLAFRGHGAYQAHTRKMSHIGAGGSSFVDRGKRAGHTYPMSENLAYGYRTPSETMKAWMKSPGHRANTVDCRAKSFAVGVVYANNGTPYYTQMFGGT